MRWRIPWRRARPGAWLRLFPHAALTCCGIGALRFVEILVKPPTLGTTPLLLFALAAGGVFWLGDAMLGQAALVA